VLDQIALFRIAAGLFEVAAGFFPIAIARTGRQRAAGPAPMPMIDQAGPS
jgi:hypothetical protein